MFTSRLSILIACFASSAALAQPLSIDWFTIDSGGETSARASFSVSSTVGQPDTGVKSGGEFQLSGGFWTGSSTPRCVADMDDGTATGTPDGGVGIEDLLYYLARYDAGC